MNVKANKYRDFYLVAATLLVMLSFAGCKKDSTYFWASESTVHLEELTALMAPEIDFDGVDTMQKNIEEQLGWNTDYVVRKNQDVVEVSYCEFFSPYVDNQFGEITGNLGKITFSLEQIGVEGFQTTPNGLLIICQEGRACIEQVNKTYTKDKETMETTNLGQREVKPIDQYLLYFTDQEKQRKAQTMFRDLIRSE